MKVVVDTNVFVSSFFGGKPRRVIDRWKRGEITLCLSESILDEYVRVLAAMGLDEENEYAELLELFRDQYNLIFAAQTPELRIVERDPDDDKFLEAAVKLDAAAVVTGDETLREVGSYGGIDVLNPNEFLREHEEA